MLGSTSVVKVRCKDCCVVIIQYLVIVRVNTGIVLYQRQVLINTRGVITHCIFDFVQVIIEYMYIHEKKDSDIQPCLTTAACLYRARKTCPFV